MKCMCRCVGDWVTIPKYTHAVIVVRPEATATARIAKGVSRRTFVCGPKPLSTQFGFGGYSGGGRDDYDDVTDLERREMRREMIEETIEALVTKFVDCTLSFCFCCLD